MKAAEKGRRPKNEPLAPVFLCVLGMTLVPFLTLTSYLLVTHGLFHQHWDELALATALSFGLACLVALPVTSGLRWAMSAFYIPLAVFLLFIYATMFVCVRYNACF